MNLQSVNHPTLPQIEALQTECAAMPQAAYTLRHHFAPGLYAREAIIPAGCVAVGKKHLHAHLIIVSGDVQLLTDDGMRRVTGTHVMLSGAGIKRAVYAFEDTTFITLHPTDETDLEKIEALVIAPENLPLGNDANYQLGEGP